MQKEFEDLFTSLFFFSVVAAVIAIVERNSFILFYVGCAAVTGVIKFVSYKAIRSSNKINARLLANVLKRAPEYDVKCYPATVKGYTADRGSYYTGMFMLRTYIHPEEKVVEIMNGYPFLFGTTSKNPKCVYWMIFYGGIGCVFSGVFAVWITGIFVNLLYHSWTLRTVLNICIQEDAVYLFVTKNAWLFGGAGLVLSLCVATLAFYCFRVAHEATKLRAFLLINKWRDGENLDECDLQDCIR